MLANGEKINPGKFSRQKNRQCRYDTDTILVNHFSLFLSWHWLLRVIGTRCQPRNRISAGRYRYPSPTLPLNWCQYWYPISTLPSNCITYGSYRSPNIPRLKTWKLNCHLVSLVNQVLGHTAAHIPEADEPDGRRGPLRGWNNSKF